MQVACSLHARVDAGLSGVDALYAGCMQAAYAGQSGLRRRRRTVRRWCAYASSCKLSINLVCIIYALRENGDGLLDSCCSFQRIFFIAAAATAIEMVKMKRRKRKIWTKPYLYCNGQWLVLTTDACLFITKTDD